VTDELVLTRRRQGATLIATLTRPHKGNALNRALIDALDQLAADLEGGRAEPDGPRALVITGAGARAYCAGADISELVGIDPAAAYEQMRRGQRVFDRIERLPMVVIAAINGAALGGGLELAMAADLRIAGPAARLGQPEITLANLPGWGGTQRLPRLVGQGRANELILTGEPVTAPRAYAIGLVNDLAEDCLAAAVALAERIAAHSPVAVIGAKRAIQVGLDQGREAGLRAEAEAVAACCTTDAQRAAVTAFLNRRARRAPAADVSGPAR
jgi:enoyl-CoA hydratase